MVSRMCDREACNEGIYAYYLEQAEAAIQRVRNLAEHMIDTPPLRGAGLLVIEALDDEQV